MMRATASAETRKYTDADNVRFVPIAIALALTITNSLAFSRCDKFSQASNIAGSALSGGNLAGSIATGLAGRFFR